MANTTVKRIELHASNYDQQEKLLGKFLLRLAAEIDKGGTVLAITSDTSRLKIAYIQYSGEAKHDNT